MTNRRSFLKNTMAFATAATAVTAAPFAEAMSFFDPKKSTLPVMQLFTDNTSAQFKVVMGAEGARYIVRDQAGKTLPVRVLTRQKPDFDSSRLVDHLFVDGLFIDKDYALEIYSTNPATADQVNNTGEVPSPNPAAPKPIANITGDPFDVSKYTLVDKRTFRALDLEQTKPRIAFLSCMFDFLPGNKTAMWDSLRNSKPDVVFMIGDQCYADIGSFGTERGLWMRHFQSRTHIDYFHWPVLVPTLTIFDDHDWGQNNCDKTMKYHADGVAIFNMLFASAPRPSFARGLGVSSMVRMFGQRFVLLDDRSFRDPDGTPDGLHWGDAQEDWFFKQLAQDRGPIWMVNGNVFFGQYLGDGEESVALNHPMQFERVIKRLAALPDRAVFVSGDVHFGEIMKIEKSYLGYETIEIVSSSMHSFVASPHNHKAMNPRRMHATFEHNFALVDLDTSRAGEFHFTVTAVGVGKAVFYKQSVAYTLPS